MDTRTEQLRTRTKESLFWIELLADLGIVKKERLAELNQGGAGINCDLFCFETNGETEVRVLFFNHQSWQSWQSWQFFEGVSDSNGRFNFSSR